MLQYHITKLQNKGFYRQITQVIKRTESHVVLSVAADFGTIQLCITQSTELSAEHNNKTLVVLWRKMTSIRPVTTIRLWHWRRHTAIHLLTAWWRPVLIHNSHIIHTSVLSGLLYHQNYIKDIAVLGVLFGNLVGMSITLSKNSHYKNGTWTTTNNLMAIKWQVIDLRPSVSQVFRYNPLYSPYVKKG